MIERLEMLRGKIQELKNREKELLITIVNQKQEIRNIQDSFYSLQESEVHLTEILRIAKIHFPRLRNQPDGELTPADHAELEKWISRAKSVDSLKSIVIALKELSKYYPHDIKSNLYGLVQKIIIEGPFKQKAQKKS